MLLLSIDFDSVKLIHFPSMNKKIGNYAIQNLHLTSNHTMSGFFILIFFFLAIFVLQTFMFIKRYKRSEVGKSLVVTGKVSPDPGKIFLVYPNKTVFVWPVIQDYFYLDHAPISMYLEVKEGATEIRREVTFQISQEKELTEIFVEKFGKCDANKLIQILEPGIIKLFRQNILNNESQNLYALESEIPDYLRTFGCELIAIKKA